MKKIILLATIALASVKLFAQEQHKDDDTLKVKWKTSRIWIFEDKALVKKDSAKKEKKKKQNFSHWGGLDIGICGLTTASNQFRVAAPDAYRTNDFLTLKYNRSWYFSLNLLQKNIHLYKNYVSLVTGLGVEWNSYNFSNNIILNADSNRTNSTTVRTDTVHSSYIKNQLKATYLKAPLLFQFNTNTFDSRKSFHLAAGMEFGYKISSWTKQVFEQDNYTVKIKRHADYNLNNFKYGIAVRAGYGAFTLFANYSLSTLFDKDKGPEVPVYPVSAGLTITF